MPYDDDDGVRTTNLAKGNLVQIIGHLVGPGGEFEQGVQDIDAFVTYLANLTGLAPGRLDQLFARISAVEAAAGIGEGGANLVARLNAFSAQVNDNRATKYWARPGEGASFWTSEFLKSALAATPIVLTGPLSVSTDGPGRGPALRFTGPSFALPIAMTHLDDNEVVEFVYRVARRVNNPSAAANVPNFEIRCYDANQVTIGTVFLPAPAIVVNDGLKVFPFTISRTAGLGSVTVPAETCFVRPLVGERGENGSLEVYSIDRNLQPFIAADATAVRATRYWARPGEFFRTWTSSLNSSALEAIPLSLGGNFSIYADGPFVGPGLRFTGPSFAMPIAMTHLDDGEVVEFNFNVARRIDNPTDDANIPNFEFRCYDANQVAIGTVFLPVPAITVANGLRKFTFRASRTPGKGSYDLPVNTRFIRPLVGERGTNGALEVYSVDRSAVSNFDAVSALYFPRPGENISSWTAQPTIGDPQIVVPLQIGTSYSIVTGVDGKVLRVASASTVGIGPIYSHALYPTDVLEYQPFVRRTVDGTTNSITVRLAVFAPDWTFLGAIALGTMSPIVSDGQISPTFKTFARDILAQYPTAARVRPYFSIASTNGALEVSAIERRKVDPALYDASYNHDNVTGMSLPAAVDMVHHIYFVHGQSLAGGQNLNEADPLLASVSRYALNALTMESAALPNSGPRLSTSPPTKVVPLVEVRATNSGETIVSGLVNHVLQRYELETAPIATAVVNSSGAVTAINLDKTSWGYASAPNLLIDNTGTGGSGLEAFAVVSSVEDGGRLLSIQISKPGAFYATPPKIIIAANTTGTNLALPKIFGFASHKVGARYIQLRQGETRWQWIDAAIRAAKTAVARTGGRVCVFMWTWKQGEADLIGGVPRQPEDIEAWMVQYARQRAADIMAITGQTVVPVMMIHPAATCHPDYDQWNQPYPRGLELLRRHPYIRISGGSYQHPHSDASHLTNAGYNHAGQEGSRVYTHEISNDGWTDIHPTSSWRESATTLKVQFAVPPPETPLRPRLGLVVDLSDAIVKLDGIQGYGGLALRSRSSGRALTITGITVDADGRTLTITHDAVLADVPAASVVPASNALTVSPRIGMETGTRVRLTTTGTLPGGLFTGRDYYVIRTLANQIKLAATLADALATVPTPVSILNAGTGITTLTSDGRASGDAALQLVYATRRNPGNTNDDGPVLGARGCLRNNRGQVNMYDGYLSHDWATPFDILVTATAPFNRGLRFVDFETLKTANWTATDPVTGETFAVTAEVMKKYQEYAYMPTTYASKISGQTAETMSKVVILPDDKRYRFQIQCETADIAINIHGGSASFNSDDPVIYAGSLFEFENKGGDAVSVIARAPALRTDVTFAPPCKLAIDYDRTEPVGYSSGSATADQALSAYPDQSMNKAYRSVLRDRINMLVDSGRWDSLDVFMPPVHSKANLVVNLAKPRLAVRVVEVAGGNQMIIVPYRSYQSGGAGAYLLPNLTPSTGLRVALDSAFMATQVELGDIETGLGIAGNSASLLLKPNSAAGKHSLRSGGNANDNVNVAAANAFLAMNRIAADKYSAYVEATETVFNSTLTIAERQLAVCAVYTASQTPPTVSNQKVKAFVMGQGQSVPSSVLAVRDALKAIFAVGDTL